jgi:hypothetical protein
MRISRIGVVGLAAAAMLASGAGYALAASPSGTTITGNEHFSLMTTQPSAARYVVIANGLFTAGGVDISGAKVDLVKLPTGTFRVHHGGAVTVIRQTLNPLTCLATFSGKVAITIGQGTGQFKGITGSGTATVNSVAILTRNKQHRCATARNPAVLEQTISANATVTL